MSRRPRLRAKSLPRLKPTPTIEPKGRRGPLSPTSRGLTPTGSLVSTRRRPRPTPTHPPSKADPPTRLASTGVFAACAERCLTDPSRRPRATPSRLRPWQPTRYVVDFNDWIPAACGATEEYITCAPRVGNKALGYHVVIMRPRMPHSTRFKPSRATPWHAGHWPRRLVKPPMASSCILLQTDNATGWPATSAASLRCRRRVDAEPS